MRRSIIILFFLLTTLETIFSQQAKSIIRLQSERSTITINQGKCKYILITVDQKGDSLKSSIKSIKGNNLSIFQNEITIIPLYEKSEMVTKSCIKQKTESIYPHNSAPININIKNISQIFYKSKTAAECSEVGTILTIIGSLTTFIVAPLASINYSNGTINSQTYYTYAATGIGLCAISIPLFLFSKEHHYHLMIPKNPNEKQWKLVQ
jgi:hypothetical protein